MKYVIFGHGGSHNHGCEAIVRTTLDMITPGASVDVYTADIESDVKFGISDNASFFRYKNKNDSELYYNICKIIYKISGNYDFMNEFTLKDALSNEKSICLSVGGDNYCNAQPKMHASRNKLFSKNNKTVLWGCSVSPELLADSFYVEDMKRYSLITARETLTYNALLKAGIKNAKLVSDPAFTLKPQETTLPEVFDKHRVVGINISPLVMKYEKDSDVLLKNTKNLIEFILKETDYNIALIPHVLLPNNNDLVPLKVLFEEYKKSNRVCLIDDDDTLNCCQLKYVISKCAFLIAARTHASIAAYSSCVPTLVLGYSVKSQGIAKDIFGSAENYVLPVDKIKNDNEIVEAFRWLLDHKESIKQHYDLVMPEYINKAYTGSEYLRKLG